MSTTDFSLKMPRLDTTPALAWHYTSVHLWRETAESLLSLHKQGIIPLIGLMQIQHPQTTLPEVVNLIKTEPDTLKQYRLFGSLLALVQDEELLAMLEKLIESDEYEIDSPYLRRHRHQLALARQEVENAKLAMQRKVILETIETRLNPTILVYRQIENKLGEIQDLDHLHDIFLAALQTNQIESFLDVLSRFSGSSSQ